MKKSFNLDLYIVYRILKTLKDNGPMTKTALALYSKLNYQRAVRYLERLQSSGLVEVGKEVYLTRKGIEVLEKIESVLKDLGL
ncbi:MAG: winged helix-turn-helix domain-containing protein [Thermofilaceae archaeon]